MKLHLLTILGLSLSLLFAGCDDDDTTSSSNAGETAGEAAGTEAGTEAGEMGGEEVTLGNIVETAVADGSFTTLVSAVEAAGLVDFLSGEGPFTVLAPNDDAFAALPEGTVEALVEDANNGGDQLAKILQLHVVAAAVMSTDLTDGQVVSTANGDLTVSISGDTVTFSNDNVTATVVAADVQASNGVIHVIDQVLLPVAEAPPAEKNIVETAVDDGNFETLVAAVEAAGLAEFLSGDGPFTVLAPNDAAFAALPEGTVEDLVEDANNGGDQLAKILKLHVVAAAVMSTDLTDGQVVTTANGDLTVSISGDTVTFSNGNVTATVVTANIEASNGVIHVIDQVLLPAAEAPTEKNIVETAIADGNFETLVAAVEAANLVELLSSEGPFTVLAPTDDAFAALEEGTVERLVMDAQMGGTQLADILSLHVITTGAVMSGDLEDGLVVTTANGDLTVGVSGDGVTFTSANSTATVVGADVPATNGVIHAIDTVLLP